MKNLRKYGKAPFDIAVIHSDPSEREEMYINGEKRVSVNQIIYTPRIQFSG